MENTAVKPKSKPLPPPYPRPVPGLLIEELPPCPEDLAWDALYGIQYYAKDSRDIVDPDGRAAKRRRIQTCAHAFLRGEQVGVMSAKLKGPFKDGWKNPWAMERRVMKGLNLASAASVEIPETTKKISSSIEQEEGEARRDAEVLEAESGSRRGGLGASEATDKALDYALSPFAPRLQRASLDLSPKVSPKVKEKRVEEWLRTNNDFAKRSEVLVHSSPTPSRRVPREFEEHGDDDVLHRAPQPEPPHNATYLQNQVQDTAATRIYSTNRLLGAERQLQKLSRDVQNIITEPLAQTVDDLYKETSRLTHEDIVPVSFEEPMRAEHAILKSKFGALQTAPADAHMSPFEFRQAAGNGVHANDTATVPGPDSEMEAVVEADDNAKNTGVKESEQSMAHIEVGTTSLQGKSVVEMFATAPQLATSDEPTAEEVASIADKGVAARAHDKPEAAHGAPDTAPPQLVSAVSHASTTDLLPSAQPRPENLHSVSSGLRDDKLASIKQPAIASDGTDGSFTGPADKASTQDQHTSPLAATNQKNVQNPPDSGFVAEVITPIVIPNAADLNTQEMLADIEPFDLSTVKKAKCSAQKDTPVTAPKSVADKKKKKTSFTTERSSMTSHGSIQGSMKARISKKLGSSPVFLLGKANPDVELSDEASQSNQKRPRLSSSSGIPKSILKSTNFASSPKLFRTSTKGVSTGQEQGNPLHSGQNGLEEDNFDLDAAIDDLGSFLGTWDAEKEASSLDIEL